MLPSQLLATATDAADDPTDDLRCPICFALMLAPRKLPGCGAAHRALCSVHLILVAAAAGCWAPTCPIDRRVVSAEEKPLIDETIEAAVQKLSVRCPNAKLGCQARFALGEGVSHLQTCSFRTVQCPNCGKPQSAEKLERHRENCFKHCGACGILVPRADSLMHTMGLCLAKPHGNWWSHEQARAFVTFRDATHAQLGKLLGGGVAPIPDWRRAHELLHGLVDEVLQQGGGGSASTSWDASAELCLLLAAECKTRGWRGPWLATSLRAAELEPTSLDCRLRSAEALLGCGRPAEACEAFAAARLLDAPSSAGDDGRLEAICGEAAAHDALGRKEEASVLWARARGGQRRGRAAAAGRTRQVDRRCRSRATGVWRAQRCRRRAPPPHRRPGVKLRSESFPSGSFAVHTPDRSTHLSDSFLLVCTTQLLANFLGRHDSFDAQCEYAALQELVYLDEMPFEGPQVAALPLPPNTTEGHHRLSAAYEGWCAALRLSPRDAGAAKRLALVEHELALNAQSESEASSLLSSAITRLEEAIALSIDDPGMLMHAGRLLLELELTDGGVPMPAPVSAPRTGYAPMTESDNEEEEAEEEEEEAMGEAGGEVESGRRRRRRSEEEEAADWEQQQRREERAEAAAPMRTARPACVLSAFLSAPPPSDLMGGQSRPRLQRAATLLRTSLAVQPSVKTSALLGIVLSWLEGSSPSLDSQRHLQNCVEMLRSKVSDGQLHKRPPVIPLPAGMTQRSSQRFASARTADSGSSAHATAAQPAVPPQRAAAQRAAATRRRRQIADAAFDAAAAQGAAQAAQAAQAQGRRRGGRRRRGGSEDDGGDAPLSGDGSVPDDASDASSSDDDEPLAVLQEALLANFVAGDKEEEESRLCASDVAAALGELGLGEAERITRDDWRKAVATASAKTVTVPSPPPAAAALPLADAPPAISGAARVNSDSRGRPFSSEAEVRPMALIAPGSHSLYAADLDMRLLVLGSALYAQQLLLRKEGEAACEVLRELVNLAPSLLRSTFDAWGYARSYCLVEQLWLEAYAGLISACLHVDSDAARREGVAMAAKLTSMLSAACMPRGCGTSLLNGRASCSLTPRGRC